MEVQSVLQSPRSESNTAVMVDIHFQLQVMCKILKGGGGSDFRLGNKQCVI